MRVKICGITNFDDANICAEYGADSVGFIFYRKSKRYISPEKAEEIIKKLPAFIKKIGVFVNEDIDLINKIGAQIKLNIVQLHGDEGQQYIDKCIFPVIKSFRVTEKFDYNILNTYKNCNYLLDSYDNVDYGGTGKNFDWNKIPDEIRNKIILAGGISQSNIATIFHSISPAAVDVSSSLEIEPGKKDHNKLIEFLKTVNKLRYIQC